MQPLKQGRAHYGVVIDPSSQYAYISNIYEDTVSVIDLEKMAVVATVPTGMAPNGISFSPLPAPGNAPAEIQLEIPEGGMNMPMP
ncbi:MAG: hypothetical protein HND47_24950 [Chloroflexi bacterium]|nr:hypothetical protein [Chloroflexota bacterium]